jgi:hypothetical protein
MECLIDTIRAAKNNAELLVQCGGVDRERRLRYTSAFSEFNTKEWP